VVQRKALTPGSYKAKNMNSDLFVCRKSARDPPSMRRQGPVLLWKNSRHRRHGLFILLHSRTPVSIARGKKNGVGKQLAMVYHIVPLTPTLR